MSRTARIRSAVVLATIAILAGCNDVVAPVVSKIQEIATKVDNLLTCDNSWATANSGQWSTASMWSAGHVPMANENVCITLEGNYTVTLRGQASVNSVTVSAPGNSVKPKLAIEGFWSSFNFQEIGSRLTVANGIDNYGWMELTSAGGPQAGYAQLFVTGGTFYNHDISSFRSLIGASAGAGRYVQGTVINDGTMSFEAPTSGSGTLTNNALFTVPTGGSLAHSGGGFVQANGTFNINGGGFTESQGGFEINGGEMIGSAPVLFGVALKIGSPSVPATVVLRGANTLTGDVGANQVLQVEGWQLAAGWTETAGTLTSAAGFTNAGTIRLTSTGGPANGMANLTGPANESVVNTGTIEVLVGVGNVRSINASIDNRAGGVVDLQQNTSFGLTTTYTNAGTWKVATGKLMYVQANNAKFIQNGGTLELDGASYSATGAHEFEMNGGAITGEPWIQGTLRIGAGSTATGRILITGSSTLIGDVQHGQTVSIDAYSNCNCTLNAPASFTNHGTIILSGFGSNPGTASLGVLNGGTITNAADGRIEANPGSAPTTRVISGNFVNNGTLDITQLTLLLGPTIHTTGPVTGGGELRNWGGTMYASGTMNVNMLNAGAFHIGQSDGAAGALAIGGWFVMSGGSLNVNIGGTVPGVDFDRMTVGTGGVGLNSTLNVSKTTGGCASGGASYEVISAPNGRSGDFTTKTGLNFGDGHTVMTVPGTTNYVLNVAGPLCIPPDITAPVIAPVIASGTPGDNSWYTSDVTVTWNVTDAESPVTSTIGCDATTLTEDTAGITYTCTATSAGGSATRSVTIKRDATPPVVSTSRAPAANANGWNKTDVTATWSASDGMSGLVGSGTATQLFSTEAANQAANRTFTDRAGNSTSVDVSGISIDKTAPWFEERRQPANANGWNNTNVGVTFFFFDNLWVQQPSTYSQVVTTEGAGQHITTTIVDLAGNMTVAKSSEINIDKTAPVVTASRLPAANANGWNNTDVNATWTATDALSGVEGAASATQAFTAEGAGQGDSRTFTDLAGNSATATVSGISIDKTAPVVTVTRNPLAGPDGWNETNVTATYSASDALSGIAGAASFTQVFSIGANQGGSHTFTDLAGNSATGSISGINVRTPPPPPPAPGGNSIGSANPGEIWPPNNKMVAVKVTMCTGVSSFTLRSVTNNETGTDDVEGWAIGTADLNGSVRAQRDGDGDGRTYTLLYSTVSSSGAAGMCTVTVSVPHDQGKKK